MEVGRDVSRATNPRAPGGTAVPDAIRLAFASLSMVLCVALFAVCGDDDAGPPAGSLTVASLVKDPVYDREVVVHGRVSDLGELLCPCFTLTSDKKSIGVWYDLMVESGGQPRPPVDVSGIENGDQVVVTGELRRPGSGPPTDFWASKIEKLD